MRILQLLKVTSAIVIALFTSLLSPPIDAQNYPTKPIQLVLSFPPGSGTDFATRVIADKLRDRLGQPIVVDNRPGAGAVLAETYTAKATADGHTIAMSSTSGLVVAPNTRLKLGYDSRRDFAPISLVCEIPQWIVATKSLPVRSLAELAKLAKSHPGQLSFGSQGQGTIGHLGMALWMSMARIEMAHIPYKGGQQAMPDVISGRVPLLWESVSSAMSVVRAGKLKALAVAGGERHTEFPQVPTIAESGFPGYELTGLLVALVPAATPKVVVDRLSTEFMQIVKMPDVRAQMTSGGLVPIGSTVDEARARISSYLDKFALAVKVSGYQPE